MTHQYSNATQIVLAAKLRNKNISFQNAKQLKMDYKGTAETVQTHIKGIGTVASRIID